MSALKGSIQNWRNNKNNDATDGERNPASNQYKGLTSFIADIRSARARELEEKRINKELANIRQKFKEGRLTSYDKKKYVCKLLYIYILGWDLDFGHLEAVNLISGNKFSEKQIGYLAVTLFLHEQHELLSLVVNSIRKDLLDNNELNNCLALHAIANIGGKNMGESLSGDVYRLLISQTSTTFVKKKSALTLLRLYRKYPPVVNPEWATRIITLMDDSNMGVALSVTSLILALALDAPDRYEGCYAKAAARLKKIVVDREYSVDYEYYQVPCPWLQIKLLRLLQYYPPSNDTYTRELIRTSVMRILDVAMEPTKNVQQNNAQNAVLFEAIKLVIHLDTEETLMVQISSRLGKFIVARETNVRYLGLEAMTHLASRGETLEPIKKNQRNITASLKDRDITVRRQALDLLYSMCDHTNAQSIVTELLKHLQVADYAIREEMVLKIAILAERYATEAQWYVDISLRLLALAGDHVSDEVWQRVIQIVTNNEELQIYAVRQILRYVKADQCHESLAKIGAYLLGEFGHLIADDPGCSPIEQFMALQNKLQNCSNETKASILTAFIKFINLFPEVKSHCLNVFDAFSDIMESELQQRACEYLAVANMPTDELLRTVFDEMPPFPERASALLSRVQVKHGKLTEKRGGLGVAIPASAPSASASQAEPKQPVHTDVHSPNQNGASATPIAANGSNGHGQYIKDLLSDDDDTPITSPTASVVPDIRTQEAYKRLILRAEGILYDDQQLQIGLRTEYRAQMGCVILYYQNKTPSILRSFTSTLAALSSDGLKADIKNLPIAELTPQTQSQQVIMFEATDTFDVVPQIRITYSTESMQSLHLQLPVLLHKYMEPAELASEDFFKRWKQIGPAPREAQQVFGLQGDGRTFTSESIRNILQGFNWGILDNVDPNAKNFVGASVVHTTNGGKYGCLMRLEPNYQTMMYRLTIRATGETVPPVLMKAMIERLQLGEAGTV